MANPQEKVLRKKNAMIVDSIAAGGKGTIITLAGNLLAEDVITMAIRDEAIEAATTRQGASGIMTAVLGKVRNFPEKFDLFITALRNSEMGDEADVLEQECCELKITS